MNRKFKTLALVSAAALLGLTGYASTASVGGAVFSSLFASSGDEGGTSTTGDGTSISGDGYEVVGEVLHITSADGWNAIALKFSNSEADFISSVSSIELDASFNFNESTFTETSTDDEQNEMTGNKSLTLSVPFDGNGNTLSGVTYPVFENIDEGASVSNLIVETSTAVVPCSTAVTCLGILAETNGGTIQDCIVKGTLQAPLQDMISALGDQYYIAVGGIVGLNTGTISDTYVKAHIDLQPNDSNTNPSNGPSNIYVGTIAGSNIGTEGTDNIYNIFVDFTNDYSTALEPKQIYSSQNTTDGDGISEKLNLTAGSTDGEIGVKVSLAVANNAGGNITNICCHGGIYNESNSAFFNATVVPVITVACGTLEYKGEDVTSLDSFTQLSSKFPAVSEIPFSNSSEWLFDRTWFERDSMKYSCMTEPLYRSPVPAMGKSVSLGTLSVVDNQANVSTVDQWNHLSDAFENGLTTATLSDNIGASNEMIYMVRNLGNGMTIDGNYKTVTADVVQDTVTGHAFFDVIGKGATVQNISVNSTATQKNTAYPVFGLLANVNNGTVENCMVEGTVENSLAGILGSYFTAGDTIAIGGVIGRNNGTVSNLYANTRLIETEGSVSTSLCPGAVLFGGLMARNNGEVKDVMVDNIRYYDDGGWHSEFQESLPLKLSLTLTVTDLSSTQDIFAVALQSIASGTGTPSNVYCVKGLYGDSYDSAISGTIAQEVNSATTSASFLKAEETMTMTELSKTWPVYSDFSSLFTDAEKWGFNYPAEHKATLTYRAPVPAGFASASNYSNNFKLNAKGEALVSCPYDWNNIVYALDDESVSIEGIRLTCDPDTVSNFTTMSVLDVNLYGDGHTIGNANSSRLSVPLVDSISAKGGIYNTAIVSSLAASTSGFGGLARVNCGIIKSVWFEGTISVDLESAISASDVYIGGLVGKNYGLIQSSNITTSFSSSTETTGFRTENALNSFYISNVAAVNNGQISDIYVGETSTDTNPIDFSASDGIEITYSLSAAQESSANIAIGAVSAYSGEAAKVGVVVIPPSSTIKFSTWETANLKFSNSSADSSPISLSSEDYWVTPSTLKEAINDATSGQVRWAADTTISFFVDPSLWTFNQPATYEAGNNNIYRYPIPSMHNRTVDVEKGIDDKYTIAATDSASIMGLFEVLGDENSSLLQSADVNITKSVVYKPIELDVENITADNVSETLEVLPTIPSYSGTMNASSIENLSVQSAGLFNTIAKGGVINDLVLSDAVFYVDPRNTSYRVSTNTTGDADTVYVSVLASNNMGSLNNVAFSGSIVMDEDVYNNLLSDYKTTNGKELVVCIVFVDKNDGDLTGFFYPYDVETEGNKRLIAFKQNLCTGENKRKSNSNNKVAVRNNNGNKSFTNAVDFDAARFQESEVSFDDDEFKNGLVACWLNYAGKGFTGEYTAKWAQGTRVPVTATSTDKALYKVNYEVEGEDCITSAPTFANGGSEITIEYTKTPVSIMLGSTTIAPGASSTTLTYKAGETLKVSFVKTSLSDVDDATFSVAIDGNKVTFTGAEGKVKEAFDLTGRRVASTNGDVMTLRSGIYILRADNYSTRVVIK